MLDVRFIRENVELVRQGMEGRGSRFPLDELLRVDGERRELIQRVEELRARRNKASEEIGRKRNGLSGAGTQALLEEMRAVAEEVKRVEMVLKGREEVFEGLMLSMPNLPHPSVPVGRDEKDNVVVKRWGDIPEFSFAPLPHWDVGERLGILDMERAAKITGSRFAVYHGLGARLERALINFMLDLHTGAHGYREVLPPFIVNEDSLRGTGQLPKFSDDLFRLEGWNYYLIPTAEVPVTNLHREEVLEEELLPLRYVAYTPCFRSEAGSHGRDTRGIIRQHQFNKVELVKFARPEGSYDELESLLLDAEEVLQRLGLPYRVVALCSGDLGFAAAKTYDLEVWLPGQNRFCEISSCSNFETFQARRAAIRYRSKGSRRSQFLHTLNGSGLAVGRTVVAILENFQDADGCVEIPAALRPYMNGVERIAKG